MELPRTHLPIPGPVRTGLITYDAKDPDTPRPPIREARPPAGGADEEGGITEMDSDDNGNPAGTVDPGSRPPNILFVHVDNLGMGELGCYGGGVLRGAETTRLDAFAREGLQLLNYAPETQCTPTRSALMTGRYAIRSGNGTAVPSANPSGLVAWERTMGDVLSDAGYATAVYGKWHIGDTPGRYPTDHGFDEWYGVPDSYDSALWPDDPFYDPDRDPKSFVVAGVKGGPVEQVEQLTMEVRRNIDREYLTRAEAFIRRSVDDEKPFYVYFNHSMMHLPTIPRAEYQGVSGAGDFADSMMELDGDFGELLDLIDELGIAGNTVVVFAGDNGAEEALPWRGSSGFFEGSYFTGMEGSLRTPCLIRWPGRVEPGRVSNEIVHVTDMFPTLIEWAGGAVPDDREIDGKDQRAFFAGEREKSNREGFPFWNAGRLYGVKWQNFKISFVDQKYFFDAAPQFANPRIVNLLSDPKEREPIEYPHLHTWTLAHFNRLVAQFEASVAREPLIPPCAPLDYVPARTHASI